MIVTLNGAAGSGSSVVGVLLGLAAALQGLAAALQGLAAALQGQAAALQGSNVAWQQRSCAKTREALRSPDRKFIYEESYWLKRTWRNPESDKLETCATKKYENWC